MAPQVRFARRRGTDAAPAAGARVARTEDTEN